jgi:sirohydrochlorin ferrochelatase
MTLILAAHGTRDPAGTAVVYELASLVGAEVAFVDVREPSVEAVLRRVGDNAVVVPAFLASGYHVRVDLPAQVAGRARITPPLGPAPSLVAVAHDRLLATGWRPGTPVTLAAAGSSDPRAQADVRHAAHLLSTRIGAKVHVGYLTQPPRIHKVRGAIATWLLAPGRFHQALTTHAPTVSDPLGAHPLVAELITRRYTDLVGAQSYGASVPAGSPGDSPLRSIQAAENLASGDRRRHHVGR